MEEIGTERSREKPINIIEKNIQKNKEKISELKNFENIKYEIEQEKNNIKNKLEKNNIKNNLLKEIKKIKEKNNLENEKIKIKENIIKENIEKIKNIKNNISENNEKYLEKENDNGGIDKKYEKNKLKNKIIIGFILLAIINVLWILYMPKIIENQIVRFGILITFIIYFIFSIIQKNKLANKIKNIEKNKKIELEKINSEKNNLENEKKILEKNSEELNEEINKIKIENNFIYNLDKQKIINHYLTNMSEYEINQLFNSEKIDDEINLLENEISNQKTELNKLELKKDNIDPQLENLANLEEELSALEEQYNALQKNNESIELAKRLLEKAYEKMKNSLSPIFTEKLSKNISKITRGKYTNLYFSDEQGLTVELDNGNYVPAERLSIGTIDQLYLSLRLAMLDDISKEKVPLILDETFAYYDNDRLKNILVYLTTEFKDRQIIIFTCTNREKDILKRLSIDYNYVEL